jgi:hypothetical protein
MPEPVTPSPTSIPIRPADAPFGSTPRNGTGSAMGTNGAGVESDWTDQVADLVVDTVDKVRDRTTGPIISGSRYFVFGIVAVVVAIPLVVMGIILIGRLLELFPGEIWISYTVLGAILVLFGMLCWRQRRQKADTT